jgi:hypothetical protein
MLLAAMVLAVGGSAARGATLLGNYDLASGSYANTLGGTGQLGSLTPVSTSGSYGFVTSGTNPGWFWSGGTAPGTGLTLSGLPVNDTLSSFGNYSIGLRFSLGDVSGYRRLIQFKDVDSGQYAWNSQFRFFVGANDPTGGAITADTTVDFVLTRNAASGLVNAYLDGSSTPIFSFVDGVDARTDANRTLQFFRDNSGGLDFSPGGGISLLRVWDGPLAAGEIPTAMTAAVPEPAGGALAATATVVVLWRFLRRRPTP